MMQFLSQGKSSERNSVIKFYGRGQKPLPKIRSYKVIPKKKFEVGQAVYVQFGMNGLSKSKIKKITPKGQIVLEDPRSKRFNMEGTSIGGDGWHRDMLLHPTKELDRQYHEKILATYFESRYISELSDENITLFLTILRDAKAKYSQKLAKYAKNKKI